MSINLRGSLDFLGKKVTDKVTGFHGVVASVTFDLYGCVQCIVIPPAGSEGKQEDGRWYDINRLTVSNEDRVMPLPRFDYGDPVISMSSYERGPGERPSGRVY